MRIVDVCLFWLHLTLIAFSIISGFFLPLPVVISLILLHKLHLILFGDCLLTLLKRHIGNLTSGEDFIQLAAKKLFKKTITSAQSNKTQLGIYGAALFLSTLRWLLLNY